MELHEKLLTALFKKKIQNDLELFGNIQDNGKLFIEQIKYKNLYTMVQVNGKSTTSILKSLADLNLSFSLEKDKETILYDIEATEKKINELFINALKISNQTMFKKNIEKIKISKNKRKKVLSPIENVFFSNEILNEVLLKTSIPDLISNEIPKYPGVILYGPAGTGKTVLEKAISQIYKNAGAFSGEIHLSADLSAKWVGSRGKSLETKILKALDESNARSMPSLIYLDEATTLMRNTQGESNSNYYQEGLDVMKKYIGNYSQLIFMITTNDDKINFDSQIIREGRLTPIKIDFPEENERKNMFKYFVEKNMHIKFNSSNYLTLARLTPKEQGAFIEEFTRTYLGNIQKKYFKENNTNLKNAMIKNNFMDKKRTNKELKYKNFKKNLISALKPKNKKKNFGFQK